MTKNQEKGNISNLVKRKSSDDPTKTNDSCLSSTSWHILVECVDCFVLSDLILKLTHVLFLCIQVENQVQAKFDLEYIFIEGKKVKLLMKYWQSFAFEVSDIPITCSCTVEFEKQLNKLED